jgi:hypothetical protein
VSVSDRDEWIRPQALAIPKEGYFKLEQGKYGPVFPRTPACYGFTIIAKIKPSREQVIREYGKTLEKALEADPSVLAPLKLHYLRWKAINSVYTSPRSLRLQRAALNIGRSWRPVFLETVAAVAYKDPSTQTHPGKRGRCHGRCSRGGSSKGFADSYCWFSDAISSKLGGEPPQTRQALSDPRMPRQRPQMV